MNERIIPGEVRAYYDEETGWYVATRNNKVFKRKRIAGPMTQREAAAKCEEINRSIYAAAGREYKPQFWGMGGTSS